MSIDNISRKSPTNDTKEDIAPSLMDNSLNSFELNEDSLIPVQNSKKLIQP